MIAANKLPRQIYELFVTSRLGYATGAISAFRTLNGGYLLDPKHFTQNTARRIEIIDETK